MDRTPMFPLGSVVFPGSFVPLRVFEPRYRILVEECLAGDRRFGTVLIDRGSEVGGDDVRTDVGTMLRIVDAASSADGQWSLLAIGEERIVVDRWLADDPHPVAEVSSWPSAAPDPSRLVDIAERFAVLVDLAIDLGHLEERPEPSLDPDPGVAAWQWCSLVPLGPADRHELLRIDDHDRRLERCGEMIAEQCQILTFRGPRPG